jgi:RNA polymerase sigma factor (sigma-70 family)
MTEMNGLIIANVVYFVIIFSRSRLTPQMTLPEFKIKVFPLKDKLFRFAKRMLERTEEAEDIVQEVFIKLWNKRDTLDEYRSVEALAMIATKNMCLDRLKAKRYPVENMEDHRGFLEQLPAESRPDHSDLIHGIHAAMKTLPEQQRMIVHMRDVEGYEFSEIAEVMEMNENAIRVALSRARKRIRELIEKSPIYELQRN